MWHERPTGAPAAVVAATVAMAVMAVAWAGLTDAATTAHLVILCALAALPALATFAPRWRPVAVGGAAVIGAVGAISLAVRVPAWDLVRLDADAWARARAIIPDGLREAGGSPLPAVLDEAPALVALLDMCLWALCVAAAWQIVVRRLPIGALVIVAAALGYRWTVEPPAAELPAGVLALAACVVILALSGWRARPPGVTARRALAPVALCAGAAAVALVVAAGPAAEGDGWWDWREWRLDRPGDPGAAALELRQRYGTLDRDRRPRAVLAVATERALPLRAAVLDEFDGDAFSQVRARQPDRVLALDGGRVAFADSPEPSAARVDERIRILATNTNVLIAPARPVAAVGLPGARVALHGDTVNLGTTMREGDEYAVRSVVPDASARDLSGAAPYRSGEIPVGSTRLRPRLWGPPADTPAWGTGGTPPADADLGAYAPVRRLAREVVGDAPTAYAAVARIEAHLRREYRYDEQPPAPSEAGTPAISEFLFGSRRGFCQHFAGAMGVMLRSVGIPARVAVGYTPGSYDVDADLWIVDDRDAHSWVEVWFPEYGWLAFDPTPGRNAPTPASVSSPAYDPPSVPGDPGRLDLGLPEPDPATAAGPDAPTPAQPDAAPPEEPAAGEDDIVTAQAPSGTATGWWAALGAVLLTGAGIVAWPVLRRLRARRRGDPRIRVAAAVTDLERALAAAGIPVPEAAAPGERARLAGARAGIDAGAFYRRTAEARFGAGEPAAGDVEWAWRENARLRRELRRTRPWRLRLRRVVARPGTVKT